VTAFDQLVEGIAHDQVGSVFVLGGCWPQWVVISVVNGRFVLAALATADDVAVGNDMNAQTVRLATLPPAPVDVAPYGFVVFGVCATLDAPLFDEVGGTFPRSAQYTVQAYDVRRRTEAAFVELCRYVTE
jgi:hypothetical protein